MFILLALNQKYQYALNWEDKMSCPLVQGGPWSINCFNFVVINYFVFILKFYHGQGSQWSLDPPQLFVAVIQAEIFVVIPCQAVCSDFVEPGYV